MGFICPKGMKPAQPHLSSVFWDLILEKCRLNILSFSNKPPKWWEIFLTRTALQESSNYRNNETEERGFEGSDI